MASCILLVAYFRKKYSNKCTRHTNKERHKHIRSIETLIRKVKTWTEIQWKNSQRTL